jgi:DNA-binding SARP family transcriptional activator
VQVEIALTGDVSVGDVVLAGPSRVVLAALVLERPGGVVRERLADIVWPDGPPRTWASALRTHVSRVRSVLAAAVAGAGETVVAGDGGYQLVLPPGVDVRVDVELAVSSLRVARDALASGDAAGARAAAGAALGVLQAPFLPGHPGEWADDVRSGLDEALVGAYEVTGGAALAAGDAAGALAAADAAVARAPLRESAHRGRMAALAAAGNRAEALRAYQRLRRALADELGVDPSPETEAAYLALLGPAAAPAGPASPTHAGVAARPPVVAPFVGREAELAALAGAWEQAAAGARHVVVVTGEAGIGKTRLTTEAARRVGQQGGLVLFGRCDQEAIVPYQPVVEALDGLVAATPADELPALGDDARAELAAVLPSLPGPRRAAGGDGRARLFAAVTDLVVAAAKERPLLLVLDDLQWADDDTLLLVRHVLRRAGDAAVLVVAITRDHDLEPGHALGEVVHSLERDGWVRRLPLTGLAESDVRELVGSLAGGDDASASATARRLIAETAGNPYLVTELLRAGGPDASIPPGVHALVTSRVARLGGGAVVLLQAAAVAGARFELDLAGAAAGLDGEPLLDALDAALASGLVVEEDAERYRFPHDIVRRTLVAQLSAARRRALHRALASAIEHLRPIGLDAHAAVLAHHAAAGAGPRGDPGAVHWSRVASARAAAHNALAEAVRLCRQALVLVPPGDDPLRAAVTAELGAALVAAGDPSGATVLVEGADLAAAEGCTGVLAEAALTLADAAEQDPSLIPAATRVVALAADAPDLDGRQHARLLARRLKLGADEHPPAAAVQALHAHVTSLTGPSHVDERRRLAAELTVLAEASEDPHLRILAAHDRAMAAATLGDEETVTAALADLTRAATAPAHATPTDPTPPAATPADLASAPAAPFGDPTPPAATPAALASATATPAEPSPPTRLAATPADAATRAATPTGSTRPAATPADAAIRAATPTGPTRPAATLTAAATTDPSCPDRGPADPFARAALADRAAARLVATGPFTGAPGALAEVAATHDALAPGSGEAAADRHRAVLAYLWAGVSAPPPAEAGDEDLHALAVAALAACAAGDRAAAGRLRARLAPHADLACGDGYRTFAGAAAFHLGRLAALAGDGAEAERHLLAALRLHTAWGARPWVAWTQDALAAVLESRGRPTDREWVAGLRAEADWVASSLDLRPL